MQKNFQLFSAVLMENEQTHFGDVQFCPRLDKRWLHKRDMGEIAPLCSEHFWICKAQRWHVTCWTHNAFVQWNAICASNAFIITKIFISYDFYVISNQKSCGNCLILLRVDMSPLCSETCSAQRCYVQSCLQFLAFIPVVGEFVCRCS